MGTDELARSQHTCEFLNIGEAAADQLAAGFANQREHLWVAVLVVLALYIYIYILGGFWQRGGRADNNKRSRAKRVGEYGVGRVGVLLPARDDRVLYVGLTLSPSWPALFLVQADDSHRFVL